MTFEWFVAKRYLAGGRGARKDRFLSAVTVIAVLAVAAGVAALVLAFSINAGFREVFQERLLGATAHVTVSRADASGIRDYNQLAARLKQLPGVESVTPALYETVLISSGSRASGIVLKGIPPEDAAAQARLFTKWREGGLKLHTTEHGLPPLLIGHELAKQLGVFVGDTLLITSPQGRLTPFGLVPRYRSFEVAGVFESGFWDFDAGWVFTRLDVTQELFGLPERVSVLELRLHDINDADQVAAAAKQAAKGLPAEASAEAGFATATWMELNKSLFRALRLEKLVTALIIGLIVFVAGLNILILLVMLVLEKRRDIAVLLSLGARAAQVQRIFIAHGVAIGALGTAFGLALGYALALAGQRWQLFPLDPQLYGIAALPFRTHWLDGLAIAAVALLISFAATLYPARRATRILPVEVLRYE